jgi:hypothetical protein
MQDLVVDRRRDTTAYERALFRRCGPEQEHVAAQELTEHLVSAGVRNLR